MENCEWLELEDYLKHCWRVKYKQDLKEDANFLEQFDHTKSKSEVERAEERGFFEAVKNVMDYFNQK